MIYIESKFGHHKCVSTEIFEGDCWLTIKPIYYHSDELDIALNLEQLNDLIGELQKAKSLMVDGEDGKA